MLRFGIKAPFSIAELMELCENKIPDEDMGLLRRVFLPEEISCCSVKNDTLARWRSFDTMLRNELVKIRASRKRVDPSKYLRRDGCPESVYAAHIAINAYRRPSIIEAEADLDRERWSKLDELGMGHYFDLDALIIYAIKLSILEKWDRVESADKRRLLEDALVAAAS